MADLIITAPVKGWAAPLAEVPDPVFAEAMMGDGVAIHPAASTVHAPCDGVVVGLHAARHAVTIRSEAGAEILVHVGLETVALDGEGFRALVSEGTAVSRGVPLLEFDMDAVGLKASSLVTPVVVVNSHAFRIDRRATDKLVEVGEELMALTQIDAVAPPAAIGERVARSVTIGLAHGIHARPAARIGESARRFNAEVEIVHGSTRANVRNPVALMGLGIAHGTQVRIEARGRDAAQALAAVGDLIESMREAAAPAPIATAPVDVPEGALAGVTAARGLAIGTAAWLGADEIAVDRDAADPTAEAAALDAAIQRVGTRIAEAAAQGSDAQRHIFEAHLAFLSDTQLIAAAHAQIDAGRSAGHAWRETIAAQTAALRGSSDARVAERADDLEDLDRQVQLALAGREPEAQRFTSDTILLAHELLPSQLIGLDVAGVVLSAGGPTSHVAILAAAQNLPMLVAAGPALDDIAAGTNLILDADAQLLHVDPPADALEAQRRRKAQIEQHRTAALEAAHHACRTADGARIELFANLGSLDDAKLAVANGAEGSGLLRTEFLFMDRAAPPSEDEQFANYQAIADAMDGRPLIVRLLDIGGDKPAPYLPIAPEKNPMLGQRGVRVSLARPELLEAQIRAILRVRGDCRIMVPMVASAAELRAVREVMTRAAEALGVPAIPLGAMIETPAAAMTADLIARHADFLSIGTNDLTQYALAMDRENPSVAGGVDALHPAVVRLIAMACQGAAERNCPLGVCGGLASDPLGIPLLIGLGATELSTVPAFVPEAKALIRKLETGECQAFAEHLLGLRSAADIRAVARIFIEEIN